MSGELIESKKLRARRVSLAVAEVKRILANPGGKPIDGKIVVHGDTITVTFPDEAERGKVSLPERYIGVCIIGKLSNDEKPRTRS